MITAILGLLTALAPLIGSIGLNIIDLLIKDSAANKAAKNVYQTAMDKNKNGGAISAGEHNSYQDQVTALQADVLLKDAPVKVEAPKQ